MKPLSRAKSPEEFALLLNIWMKRWRGPVAGNGAVGRSRFSKNMRRKNIRLFRQRFGAVKLPSIVGAAGGADRWHSEDVDKIQIVFLPPNDTAETSAPDDGRSRRRNMRRLLGASIAKDEKLSLDMINAGNAENKTLPSVAKSLVQGRQQLRGLYLEAVGAAIVPSLGHQAVAELEARGAVVVSNSFLAFDMPVGVRNGAFDQQSAWHHHSHSVKDGKLRYTGKGTSIGVLDTGIDDTHPEFKHKVVGFRAFSTNGEPLPNVKCKDYDNHGTHVAGLCAGLNVGLAPDAHLSVAAVLTERTAKGLAGGYVAQIVGGLNWLAGKAGPAGTGVDVINASLGFTSGNKDEIEALYAATMLARLEGKLTVASVGNEGRKGSGKHGMPGKFAHVIAVGAIDHNHDIADFSDWGPAWTKSGKPAAYKPDLVAPGVAIISAVPKGGYMSMNGTSMAAPHISATIALLIEAEATLRGDPDRLTQRLFGLTVPLPASANNVADRYGKGKVDLARLA